MQEEEQEAIRIGSEGGAGAEENKEALREIGTEESEGLVKTKPRTEGNIEIERIGKAIEV